MFLQSLYDTNICAVPTAVCVHKFTMLKCVEGLSSVWIVQCFCVFVFWAGSSATQVSLLAKTWRCVESQIKYGHTHPSVWNLVLFEVNTNQWWHPGIGCFSAHVWHQNVLLTNYYIWKLFTVSTFTFWLILAASLWVCHLHLQWMFIWKSFVASQLLSINTCKKSFCFFQQCTS